MTEEHFTERRSGKERRQSIENCPGGMERRRNVVDRRCGFDRRRGPGIRRSEDRKSAEEGQMSDEQFEFIMAIDEYKRNNSRPFPTWTEVLEVIKALGYRKVAEMQPLEEHESEPEEAYKVPLGTWQD